MIKFIKVFLKLIITLFILSIIFLYIFSIKSNMSFEDTLAYLKTVGSDIFDLNNSDNIVVNSNVVDTPSVDNLDNNVVNKYYGNQLDDNSKIIYTELEKNIDNLKKNNYVINFSTTFNDLLNTSIGQYKLSKAFQSALDAFFYDHPELFYLDLTKFILNTKCISVGPIKTYLVEIVPKNNNYLHNGFNSEDEVYNAIRQVEKVKDNILDTLSESDGYDIYYKIKYVHNMLVNSIEYDESSNKNTHNIYGALIQKKVVCEGYAKAFKYIMDNLNIECILVTGTASSSSDWVSSNGTEKHMWNYVFLNNHWYGVDVTWDDPIIVGGSNKNNLRYNYFMKGRNTFYASHNASGKISNTGMLFSIPSLSLNNYYT